MSDHRQKKRVRFLSAVACLLAVGTAGMAEASVSLPPTPIPPELTGSYAKCLARLQKIRDEVKAWKATPTNDTASSWEVLSSSSGDIVIISPRRARFVRSQVITNYSLLEGDASHDQVRAQSTTDEATYTCDGQVLSGVQNGWAGMEMYMTRDQAPRPALP